MRFLLSFLLSLFALSGAQACPRCRPKVLAGIYNEAWSANAALLLLPLVLVGAVATSLYYAEPIATRLGKGRRS